MVKGEESDLSFSLLNDANDHTRTNLDQQKTVISSD